MNGTLFPKATALTNIWTIKTLLLNFIIFTMLISDEVHAGQVSKITMWTAPGSGGILTLVNTGWLESRAVESKTTFTAPVFITGPVCMVQEDLQPMWFGIYQISVVLLEGDRVKHLTSIFGNTIRRCADKWIPNSYLSWDSENHAWWLTDDSHDGNLVNLQIGPGAWFNDRSEDCDDIAVCISKYGRTVCSPNYTCSLTSRKRAESQNTTTIQFANATESI